MSDFSDDEIFNKSEEFRSDDELQDDEVELPAVLKTRYKTFKEFDAALNKWQRETFQVFVHGSTTAIKEELRDTLKYKYAWYKCVHSAPIGGYSKYQTSHWSF